MSSISYTERRAGGGIGEDASSASFDMDVFVYSVFLPGKILPDLLALTKNEQSQSNNIFFKIS